MSDETQNESAKAAADEHAHHRFAPVTYRGESWDLTHLDPFAFHHSIILDQAQQTALTLEVVVIYSCHCFTSGVAAEARASIPAEMLYERTGELRALNPVRYQLSRTLLVEIVRQLPRRKIIVASPGENYVTYERHTETGVEHYGVYFEVQKAKARKNRVILRIQSAYLREPSKRHREAKKVKFDTLLKAAHEGRKIRP